jgi:hemoglobin-like flavoprotein
MLSEALSNFVGDKFTPVMAGAWSEALNHVSATIIGTSTVIHESSGPRGL